MGNDLNEYLRGKMFIHEHSKVTNITKSCNITKLRKYFKFVLEHIVSVNFN